MCTCITLSSEDKKHLLARTMDFSFELDAEMGVFARNVKLNFALTNSLNNHYAFLGLTKDVGNYYLADGLNEFGLSAAALYFEGYAKYIDKTSATKEMIAPHEIVMWMLAKCKNVKEVLEEFNAIDVVDEKISFLGVTTPLHWVFADSSGESVVVEIVSSGMNVYENKLGILTNSPDYNWHLTNVRNYIGLDQRQVSPREMFGMNFTPFGQGSGTFGLPGDFTPPSRFIKTLYAKLSAKKVTSGKQLVISASHILNGVDIPKGSVITQRDTIDYTQYTAYILLNEGKYYYRLYDSLETIEVVLSDYNLDSDQIEIIK